MIFKVRPLIIEQVRLENRKINKNGALYEVIWFNTGDYEIHPLKPVKTISQVGRIPFNPNYPRIRNGEDVEADNRWGVGMKRCYNCIHYFTRGICGFCRANNNVVKIKYPLFMGGSKKCECYEKIIKDKSKFKYPKKDKSE